MIRASVGSRRAAAVAALAGLFAVAAVQAEVASNTYVFKEDVVLRMGLTEAATGVRVDSVRFGTVRLVRSERLAAQIVISNPGAESVEAGLALALFDLRGRLVGAAAAGPGRVRGEQTRVFNVVFQGVERAPATAATFQVSLEVP